MRKFILCLISAVALAAAPAYADRGGHGRHGGHRGHGHHGSVFWPGIAVVGALTGLAIVANSRPVYAEPYAPAPIYRAPVAAPNAWYYCQSSAMYYPYTQACPEGWQVVPARPY